MQFLTDFADQRLLLPLSLVVAAALALCGWRRGALAWGGVVAGTLGCLALLKIVFLACGWRWTGNALVSPSGHAGAAALVYGGLALLLLPGAAGPWRHWRLLLPPLLAAAVGASRLLLHAHTLPEVIVGGGVGTAGAWLLRPLAGPPPGIRPGRVAVPALLVVVALHGGRLQAEGLLRRFSIDGLWPPASCRIERGAARPLPAWRGAEQLGVGPHHGGLVVVALRAGAVGRR